MTEEKTKPFRLVKYFTYTSLFIVFIGTIILSFLNAHWAKNMYQKKSEDYAELLVENLNHQVFLQFIIPATLKYGKIQLRKQEQFELMDKVVKSTLHSFKVDMVNIYDMDHIVSYSFDESKIGRKNVGGAGYQKAVSGQNSSRLIQSGNFFQILFGFPEKSKIITFAPLRVEKPLSRISGPVIGVVEIIQDLSEDYRSIFKFQILIMGTSTAVMCVIFLILIFVVQRGEKIIHKRTIERIQLKEQLNRAERLSSLGEMAAGISHEIRNPLGIIRSSAEHLQKKRSSENRSNPILNIIIEESNRLNNIITNFLTFAKPITPNKANCRVMDIIEKNISFLESQTADTGYAIHKSFNENIPDIYADSDMIYQAFLNILLNSIQAMPGGGDIHIETTCGNHSVIVNIADTGGGFPKENIDKLWNPFFTTRESGTGLGLGIVKNIIDAHGGGVRIENRSSGGARVTVELPVYQGNE